MEISQEKLVEITKRLHMARLILMQEQPFYAYLLLQMKQGLDDLTETAYTNGTGIYWNPDFLLSLSNRETVFVLLHEVCHAALNHCGRACDDMDQVRFNIACDIVVNSSILEAYGGDKKFIMLFGEEMMHRLPSGEEGALYSVERVYELLEEKSGQSSGRGRGKGKTDPKQLADDHSFWGNDGSENEVMQTALCAAREFAKSCKQGNIPQLFKREVDRLTNPQLDWRLLLADFLSFEVNDYSFSPPDKRMQWNSFILPDYHETEGTLWVWFVVDTSGSISQQELTLAMSEIKGAIDAFDGRLRGMVSYFDADITPPIPFEQWEDIEKAECKGGGGTSFQVIFDYLKKHQDELPDCVIVLTDGYAPFPKEEESLGIPVLWIFNHGDIEAPWGKQARIITNG